MGRHGKTIGIIEKMFNKVMNTNKNEAWTTRDGVRVYEMFLIENRDIMLVHYGTTTLVYDTVNKVIKDFYGESASDRDSMNTLLDCLGHDPKHYFRFGPTIGFYLEGPENDAEESFDEVAFIIDFENGQCNQEQMIKGFQALINSGTVWKLQGTYGRMATRLINEGLCSA